MHPLKNHFPKASSIPCQLQAPASRNYTQGMPVVVRTWCLRKATSKAPRLKGNGSLLGLPPEPLTDRDRKSFDGKQPYYSRRMRYGKNKTVIFLFTLPSSLATETGGGTKDITN